MGFKNTPAMFWGRVSRTDGCWPWTGRVDRYGYGMLQYGGRHRTAHRVAYELTFGVPEKVGVIRHLCHNPLCCNPDHLKWGTQAENMADSRLAGRWDPSRQIAKTRHPSWSKSEARYRLLAGEPARSVAKGLGLPKTTVTKWASSFRPEENDTSP